MLRDGSFEASGEQDTAGGAGGEIRAAKRSRVGCDDEGRCEQIHRRLRRIAKARGALDLQEAEALREAEAACVWRRYGYASLLEYMEIELGYTPRVAIERLRVAKAIVELPALGEAMLQGELSFSAARELTRVATAETEGEWLGAARELNLRQLEELVSGHKRGDRPTDRPDPSLRGKDLRLSVRPETYALMRQALQILSKERGERIDEEEYLATVARMIIDGRRPGRAETNGGDGADGDECRKVAPYQIAVTVCSECKRGWQQGGGVKVEMSPAAIEMAVCDSVEIGSLDAEMPERARQAIPPALRRLVWHRDGGTCRVPDCRSTTNLDLHHLRAVEDGGANEMNNLILMCRGHHLPHHEGTLLITGTFPDLVFTRRASSSFATATRVVETASALEKCGYPKREAKAAAEETCAHVGTEDWPIEAWIKYALARCGRGRAA